jgi:hypothetical protein
MGMLIIKEELSCYMYWIETVNKKFCSSDYLTGSGAGAAPQAGEGPAESLYPVVISAIATARSAVRLIDLPPPSH